MTRAELDDLRASAAGWKERQHIEIGVGRLRALLDHIDRLEAGCTVCQGPLYCTNCERVDAG